MYARSTTVRGHPQAVDDGIAYVRDEVTPAVRQMDGCVGLSMLAERESGRCIVTTSWADAEALQRSAEGVRSMRQRAAEIMGGQVDVQEWEIAVVHRLHRAPDGAGVRVIWSRGDPAGMDRMIDAFRMNMAARVEQLPGFSSVSVLVDRRGGRVATSVTYDDRDSMNRSQEQGMALRHEFNTQTHMEATEVAEFDLVLAHLRVPETV